MSGEHWRVREEIMKRLLRLTVFVFVWMVPTAPVWAGQPDGPDEPARAVPAHDTGQPVSWTLAGPWPAALEAAQPAGAAQAPAPRPAPLRRRRGSMVGYIDDSTVESKIRLRLDSGFGTN